jgi:hypothetical protein
MSGPPDPVPQVARVLLRIEYADGVIREFEAERPYDLEVSVEHPELARHLLTGDPLAMPPGDVTSVALGFKANRDPRCPMTLRYEGPLSGG